ncbi:tRNA lysidine(34) synthetase TilS [Parahaliea aestuarii]|nr:tRNA lysidine(34) synthetase TilS [Parahaliea aestuarii]
MNHSQLSARHLADTLSALAAAPRWWLAYSGGLDSTVLLHLLCEARALRPELPPLTALHINHQLQADADQWQAHCAACCADLGVPFVAQSVDVALDGEGLEAAARRARHRVFERCVQAGEVLFTAHHQDDQVETLFLRLLRGAGVAGLGAMADSRPLGRGLLHRPLLDIARSELEAWARERGLRWIEDPSNADTGLDRNYLRQRVLPLIAERWPAYRKTVSRAARAQGDAQATLVEALGPLPELRNDFGDPGLALVPVLARSDRVAAALLRQWLARLGLRAPERAALLEFLRQLRDGGSGEAQLQVDGAVLQQFGVALYRLPALGATSGEGVKLGPGDSVSMGPQGTLTLVPAAAGAPGFVLAPGESLTLRFRRGGERCRPVGRGGSCSLKKFLQEQGVPPWWRSRLPLLLRNGELLAIGDRWYCENEAPDEDRDHRGGRWQVRWERNCPAPAD